MSSLTFTYSRINGINIRFDLTFPDAPGEPVTRNGRSRAAMNSIAALMKRVNQMMEGQSSEDAAPPSPIMVPALVFFHGGGLTAGNREFFPRDLKADCLENGIAFISADYRLLFPCTAHDILIDVRALFSYIAEQLNPALSASSYPGDPYNFHVSPDHLAVAGASAGAYPARLAALYADPRPKALFSLYGTGGDLLNPFYLRTPVIENGDLDLGTCARFMEPTSVEARDTATPISDCPFSFGSDHQRIPGYADRLLTLYGTMLRAGQYLDFLTGIEGLGAHLRAHADKAGIDVQAQGGYDWSVLAQVIPPEANCLFPQLHVDADFPPTYLVHGNRDKAVRVEESIEAHRILCEAGVRSELVVAKGLGHTFDQHLGPDGWSEYCGGVMPFLLEYIAMPDTEAAAS